MVNTWLKNILIWVLVQFFVLGYVNGSSVEEVLNGSYSCKIMSIPPISAGLISAALPLMFVLPTPTPITDYCSDSEQHPERWK